MIGNEHWQNHARTRWYSERAKVRFCDVWREIRVSEKYHGGSEIFGVFMLRQSAARERNRADKLSPVKISFSASCCPETDVFVRGAWCSRCANCLLWELNAFAKIVDLNVNWFVEITFVTSHDPNTAYFWKRDSWYNKEAIIMYLWISLRHKKKKKEWTRWNEIDAKDLSLINDNIILWGKKIMKIWKIIFICVLY